MQEAVSSAIGAAQEAGSFNDKLETACKCFMAVDSVEVTPSRAYPTFSPTISVEPTPLPTSPPSSSSAPSPLPTVHCVKGEIYDAETNECSECPVGTYAANSTKGGKLFAHNCTKCASLIRFLLWFVLRHLLIYIIIFCHF